MEQIQINNLTTSLNILNSILELSIALSKLISTTNTSLTHSIINIIMKACNNVTVSSIVNHGVTSCPKKTTDKTITLRH